MNYLLKGLSVLCEFSDSGEVLREYLPGVCLVVGGSVYFYHFDRLGSVRFLTDSGGSVVQEYEYDGWGNILSYYGSIIQPYNFVGKYFYYTETDISLQLLGQRWYDPQTGRFISRDPIWMSRKSISREMIINENVYLYVKNRVTFFIDPSGLKEKKTCEQILEKCLNDVRNYITDCSVNFCGYQGSLDALTLIGDILACSLCASGIIPACFVCAGYMGTTITILDCVFSCIEAGNTMAKSCYEAYDRCIKKNCK